MRIFAGSTGFFQEHELGFEDPERCRAGGFEKGELAFQSGDVPAGELQMLPLHPRLFGKVRHMIGDAVEGEFLRVVHVPSGSCCLRA